MDYKNVMILFSLLFLTFNRAVLANDDDDEATVDTDTIVESETKVEEEIEVNYMTPKEPQRAYLAEHFDDPSAFKKKWIKSQAKKDGVEADIAKYDGQWELESLEKEALPGDLGLVLKSKAKHSAISVPLKKPFKFTGKQLIVQYEVNLQNGQECGGAYIKLLSHENGGIDLKNFNDKTPYSIMFGPDKCGNDFKVHFIFRHVNPLNKKIEEKHAKPSHSKIEEAFKDKRPHLYTLVINDDNTFEIRLDHEVVSTGNLLEDFTPPVNPPKEIDDPNDFRPKDWDEREKIVDETATKPDDWDEDAPMQITDPSAVMPDGWLETEPEMIPDPEAVKQDDWDDDMDGEWEAPLISNPKCASASGCGEWQPPMIENPEYKGKWKAPMIDNPNYQGKWMPKKIINPEYFEDLEPYKITPFSAVGIEIWSMTDGIYFDNMIIADNEADAYKFAQDTFDLKIIKIDNGQAGVFKRILTYSNKHPWLYGIYVVLVAIPVVLIFACCCAEESKKDADKKKTDEPTDPDPIPDQKEEVEEEEEPVAASEETKKKEDDQEPEPEDEGSQNEEETAEDDGPAQGVRQSVRLRKSRKE